MSLVPKGAGGVPLGLDLAHALGDNLESPEINPLRVDGASVEALDAVVTWTVNHR